MKTTALIRIAAIAAFVSAPLFAQAAEVDSVKRCMDAYATQNFANATVSFADDSAFGVRTPVIHKLTRHVRVVVTDRASGKVVAKAVCEVNRTVTITQDGKTTLLAQK